MKLKNYGWFLGMVAMASTVALLLQASASPDMSRASRGGSSVAAQSIVPENSTPISDRVPLARNVRMAE